MSARDRRLSEAARERDRQESEDTDESSFDRGLREAAERQRDSSPRRRPGRGIDTGTSQPIDDGPSQPSGGDDGGITRDDLTGGDQGTAGTVPEPEAPEPEPSPEPDDDRTIAEQIGDLEPGEVLRASGSGGTGEPDVEVVSAGENLRDVREAQLIAATDLTRDQLEAQQEFETQQAQLELLGRLEASIEEQVGRDIDLREEDVRFTEEIGRGGGLTVGVELTERFVEEDLPGQITGGAQPDGPRFDPDPVEVLGRDVESPFVGAVEAVTGFAEEASADIGEFGTDLAEFVGFETDEQVTRDIEDIAEGTIGLAAIPVGIPLAGFAAGRAITPQRRAARLERARELTFDVPTGEGISDFDRDIETREVTDSAALGVPATVIQDVITDPIRQLIAEEGTRGAAIQTGTQLVATAGIFAGAAAVGPRVGTATRFAIQPGEEIAGRGGFAATRRLAGERQAQRFFPNQEPLIFSEEAALRGLRRITPSDPGIIPAIRAGELPPTPLQASRIRTLREDAPAPPSRRQPIGTPEEELFEGIGGPRGRTELFDDPQVDADARIGITDEQRRLATEITEREAQAEGFVEIATPQEAALRQFRSSFELERTERIGAGLVPPVRVRRRGPELTPTERGIFRDFRATELEARREQFRDFGTEAEFQDRIQQAERRSFETEVEIEQEIEAELEQQGTRLRTELTFFEQADEAVDQIQPFDFRVPDIELEFEDELEIEPEQEVRVPPREVERPPFETEIEPPPGEIEPEPEFELFDLDERFDDARRTEDFDPFGVRAIETTIRAIEDR
jgi:hypothetical protein